MKKKSVVDDENPEWTDEMFARAKHGIEGLAELIGSDAAQALSRSRGRPKQAVTKVPVYIRLDPEVLSAFKAMGRGWQTRINQVLRSYALKNA